MAKQIVTAGLKCPPEVGPATTMANMIPIAKAHPIWKKLPYAVTPSSLWEFRTKLATEQRPGKLNNPNRSTSASVDQCVDGYKWQGSLHG